MQFICIYRKHVGNVDNNCCLKFHRLKTCSLMAADNNPQALKIFLGRNIGLLSMSLVWNCFCICRRGAVAGYQLSLCGKVEELIKVDKDL